MICFAGDIPCHAQSHETDSLEKMINRSVPGDQQFEAYTRLLLKGQSMAPDSFYRYAVAAKEIANADHNSKQTVSAEYFIAHALETKGLLDTAMSIIMTNLKDPLLEKTNTLTYNRFVNLEAQIFLEQKKFSDASALYFMLLAKHEQARDTLFRIIDLTGIGWVNMEMDRPSDAIPWFVKAISLGKGTRFQSRISAAYSNLASCYNGLQKNDSAMLYIDTAVQLSKAEGNLTAEANCLNIKANIYLDMHQPAAAEKLLTEALAIRRQTGEPFFIVSDMTELSNFYLHTGRPQDGIAIAKEGIAIADSLQLSTKLLILYEALAENYKAAGLHDEEAATLRKLMDLKEQVYNKSSAEAMAAAEGKYNFQKNENIIIRQQLDLVKKNTQLYIIIIAAIFLAVLSFLFFTGYRKRQRMKMQLAMAARKKEEESAVMLAGEKERRRISADLHDNMGAYATAISSDIDHLRQSFPAQHADAFAPLINNSSSMVSLLSDTIWALKKESASLSAISDRIKIFMARISPSHRNVYADVREDFREDVLLTPSRAYDLFRIVQEAVNNAYRHSGAANILVYICISPDWEIRVQDDGKGIPDILSANGSGNGLVNMRFRADAAGCDIFWERNGDGGTTVLIRPKIITAA